LERKYLVLIKGLLENQQKYVRTVASHEPVKYVYTTYVPRTAFKESEKASFMREESISLKGAN
jgi:hypothetical protein